MLVKVAASDLLAIGTVVALLASACDGGGLDEYEGDEAGECDDGADNDGDGSADCDDDGCRGSPICRGGDGDADADGDQDEDGEGSRYRKVGEVVLTERVEHGETQSRGWARFTFETEGLDCGYVRETFGHCTITSSVELVCSPPCAENERCVWSEWCHPTCRCDPPNPAPCDPACRDDQWCRWNDDCSAGRCEDVPPHPLHAGPIEVTGGSSQAFVRGSPNEDGDYPGRWELNPDMDWWAAGDVLHIEAPGASFPAFSMDLPAPEVPEITTDTSAWTAATFDGSAPVTMTWTPVSRDFQIRIDVGDSRGLRCVTDDDGSFTFTAAALEAMPGRGSSLDIVVMRVSRAVVDEGADGEVTGTAQTFTKIRVR